MTGPRRTGTPYTALTLTVTAGTPTEEWCAVCKAYTRVTGDLLLLTPDGVSKVGTWTWCETCEDPGDQQKERTRA